MKMLVQTIPESQPADLGFFGAHGIWSPGVRIMRNLSFAAKALIISAMFLVPMVWVTWSYFQVQLSIVEFTAKERQGVRYLQAARPVLLQALKLRGTQSKDAGREIAALDSEYKNFELTHNELKAELSLDDAFSTLSKARLDSKNQDGDAVERFIRNTVHVQSLIALMTAATDASNLTLDPDIDSYYVMDAAAFRLPDLMERVGLMRAAGAAALRDGGLSVDFRVAIDKASAIVEFHNNNMLSGLGKAIAKSPHLQTNVSPEKARQTSLKFIDAVEKQIVLGGALEPDALNGFVALGDEAFAAQAELFNQLLTSLDELLIKRIEGIKASLLIAGTLLVTALLLAGYAFYCFFLVTRGGLRLISRHLQEMAEGDLRKAPSLPWGRDEPATVILDLRTAYDSLHQLIRKVRHSARDLTGTSGEIARASLDLSQRTGSAAAALEQQAATMEQIGSSVQAMADNSKDAAVLARENARVAQKGGEVIRDVVSVMSAINNSSQKIGDIISTIDGIAFQTNILALNAAVEAARAGEQGRGFAVVASEVRVLAQRSAAAAKEIKDLIAESVKNVEQGTTVVSGAGLTMDEILGNATRIDGLLGEIAVGSREQADGVSQSVSAIQMLEQSTQQNAALVEETSAAAGALSDQSDGLMREIANFRVA